MRRLLLVATLMACLSGGTAVARAQLDDMTRTIVGYSFTMAKVEKVTEFYERFAKWTRANPAEKRRLDQQAKQASLEKSIALFNDTPGIKALLDASQIDGRDALLLPLALNSSLAVVFAETKGVSMPPEAVNRANVDLARGEGPRLEPLAKRISAAQQSLGGPR